MKISELYIHPIKSASAVAVQTVQLNALGPQFDRRWMVVDANDKFMTQRTTPSMCHIQASVQQGTLTLSTNNGTQNTPTLDVTERQETRSVQVWADHVQATDCGDAAAKWLSDFLGKPCRLVEINDDTNRQVDPEFATKGETVSFADGFPTLIASQASLDEFNSHLDKAVDMRRFRPNIVIEGTTPYAEDSWKRIRINKIEFDLVRPCSRCIMPSINPDTAAKELHINDVLLKTRKRGRQTFFGQNALHNGTGTLNVGDRIELIE